MHFSIDHLSVDFTAKDCDIPPDERARLQSPLTELGDVVSEFPNAVLRVNVFYHSRSEVYHAEAKLQLPGQTIFSGQKAPYLDTALQRCLRKVIHKTEAYKEHPDREAAWAAESQAAFDTDIIAPEDPKVGPAAEAAAAGDYRTFRTALAGYETWLRKRIGRLVQRHPEAQARLGRELRLGDVVEEVYLNAFEEFTGRSTDVRLSEWLEGLIEPSLRALMQHPEEESMAAGLARTVRAIPVE
jgi:hypothetical protein